jgi:hypothetical protein
MYIWSFSQDATACTNSSLPFARYNLTPAHHSTDVSRAGKTALSTSRPTTMYLSAHDDAFVPDLSSSGPHTRTRRTTWTPPHKVSPSLSTA